MAGFQAYETFFRWVLIFDNVAWGWVGWRKAGGRGYLMVQEVHAIPYISIYAMHVFLFLL